MRAKIACRDITKVPRTDEGTLGLSVHDFLFEMEVEEAEQVRVLNNGIKITGQDRSPPNKRHKADGRPESGQGNQNEKNGEELSIWKATQSMGGSMGMIS